MKKSTYRTLSKYDNLSYKRYIDLSISDRKLISSYNLMPNMRDLAIILHKEKNYSLERSVRLISKPKFLEEYYKYLSSLKFKESTISLSDLKNEFRFRGFIPLSDFKGFNKRNDYIASNIQIEGEYYIYPLKFSYKRNLNIHKYFHGICIPGYTRIIYAKIC